MKQPDLHFLFVSYELHPATPGGVGVYLHHATTALLSAGHRVSLLLHIPRDNFDILLTQSAFLFPNPHLLRLHCTTIFADEQPFARWHFNEEAMYNSYLFSVALSHIHREEPVDFCEFFDYCGPAYQSLVDRCLHPSAYPSRIAVRIHSSTELIIGATNGPVDPSRAVHFAQERAALQLADCIISPGRQFYERCLLPLYPFLERKPVFHCQPPLTRIGGIDGSVPSTKNILFIGRLSKVKGAELFVAAACELLSSPNGEVFAGNFVIVGPEEHVTDGFTVDELLATVPEKFRNRFVFTGEKQHSEILELLKDALFVVFANKIESFCYAAHEVHKAGVAVILRDIPAFRDHFKDEEEALFFDGRSTDLCKQMHVLLSNTALRHKLAQSGHAWKPVTSFSDIYVENLHLVPHFTTIQESGHTTAIVLSDGNATETARTVSSLGGSCTVYVLTKAEAHDSACTFLGSRWIISRDGSFSELLPSVYSVPLSEQLIILQSGQEIAPDFLAAAQTLFAASEHISFVTCARKHKDLLSVGTDHLLPEFSLICRRHASLALVHRTFPGERLAEYLDDSGCQGELVALLRAKQNGGIGAFAPMVGISSSLMLDGDHPKYFYSNDTMRRYSHLLSTSFVAACAADFETPDATSNTFDVGVLGASKPWEGLVQQTKIDPYLTLVRPYTTQHGQDQRACCVERISFGDGITLSFSNVERVGDWTVQKGYSESVEGHLIGRSGWLSFHCPSSSTIHFRCGLSTGLVQVVRDGRSLLVDTHITEHELSLAIRLDGSAGAFITAKPPLLQLAGAELTRPSSCQLLDTFLERTLNSQNGVVAIHSLSKDAIDALLDGKSFPILSYADLGAHHGRHPSSSVVKALEQAARNGQMRKLVLIGNHSHFLTLALDFAQRFKATAVDLLFPDSFQWDPAHEANDIYFRWKRFLQSLETNNFKIMASSESVYQYFKSTFEQCYPWLAIPLPVSAHFFSSGRQPECPIFLMQGSASTNVLPAMHAAIFANHVTRIRRPIFLERASAQAWQVARDIGQAHLLTACDNIWTLISANPDPGIVLSLSPNNALLLDASAAVRCGKWFFGGKSDQFYHDDLYNRFFAIPEWEDSMAIADAIATLAEASSRAHADMYVCSAVAHKKKYAEQLLSLFTS